MKKTVERVIAVFILFFFVFNTVLYSAPINVKDISVPYGIGSISGRYDAGNGRMPVILVEDAHKMFDAQKNIAAIIGYLADRYGVREVGLEGASGNIVVEDLRIFPDKNILRRVTQKWLKSGLINGPLFSAINFCGKLRLFGLENEDIYADNFRSYIEVMNKLDLDKGILSKVEDAFIRSKSFFLNNKQSEILALYEKYKKDSDFKDLFSKLADYIDLIDYESGEDQVFVSLFYELLSLSQKVDIEKAKSEFSELVNAASVAGIIDGNYSEREKYAFVKNIALRKGVDLGAYPAFCNYQKYLEVGGKIDYGKLIEGIEKFYKTLLFKLSPDENRKRYVEFMFEYSKFKDIVSLNASKKEVLSFCGVEKLISGFDMFLDERLPLDDKKNITALYSKAMKFYELAKKRDVVIVKNILRKKEKDGDKVFALVVGGYHTDGIKNELEKNRMPYLVIKPKIDDFERLLPYREMMYGKVPFFLMAPGNFSRSTLALPVPLDDISSLVRGGNFESKVRKNFYTALLNAASESQEGRTAVKEFLSLLAGDSGVISEIIADAAELPVKERMVAIRKGVEKLFRERDFSKAIAEKAGILAVSVVPFLEVLSASDVSAIEPPARISAEHSWKSGVKAEIGKKWGISFKAIREDIVKQSTAFAKKINLSNKEKMLKNFGIGKVKGIIRLKRRKLKELLKEIEKARFSKNKEVALSVSGGVVAGLLSGNRKVSRRKFLKFGIAGTAAVSAYMLGFNISRKVSGDDGIIVENLVSRVDGVSFELANAVVGGKVYTDADYVIAEIPDELSGAGLVKTPISETFSTASEEVSFTVNADCEVYVAILPLEGNRLPQSLSDYKYSGEALGVEFGSYGTINIPLYKKFYAAGSSVEIGGALEGGLSYKDGTANYIILVKRYNNLVYNITSFSGNSYERGILAEGITAYTDAPYIISSVPDILGKSEIVKTPIVDVDSSLSKVVSFKMRGNGTVYIALFPMQNGNLPSFLDGFEPVGKNIGVTFGSYGELNMQLYSKTFKAGEEVSFGGILSEGGAFSGAKANYMVFVNDDYLAVQIDGNATYVSEVADVAVGENVYMDAGFKLAAYPDYLSGAQMLKTSFEDTLRDDNGLITFVAGSDMDIYVALFPLKDGALPPFMEDYESVGETVSVNFGEYGDLQMPLYKRHAVKGEVVVLDGALSGGNSYDSAASNYVVFLKESERICGNLRPYGYGFYRFGSSNIGDQVYSSNADFKLANKPFLLEDAIMVKTDFYDTNNAADTVASFVANDDIDVYIASFPLAGGELPEFMKNSGYVPVGDAVGVEFGEYGVLNMPLYKKSYKQGEMVYLGGILNGGKSYEGAASNYIVFVKKHIFSPLYDTDFIVKSVNDTYGFTVGVYSTETGKNIVLIDNYSDTIISEGPLPKDPNTGEDFTFTSSDIYVGMEFIWKHDAVNTNGYYIYRVIDELNNGKHLCNRAKVDVKPHYLVTVNIGTLKTGKTARFMVDLRKPLKEGEYCANEDCSVVQKVVPDGNKKEGVYYISDSGTDMWHVAPYRKVNNDIVEGNITSAVSTDIDDSVFDKYGFFTLVNEFEDKKELLVIRYDKNTKEFSVQDRVTIEKGIEKTPPAETLPAEVNEIFSEKLVFPIPENILNSEITGDVILSSNGKVRGDDQFVDDIADRFATLYSKAVTVNKKLESKYGNLFSLPKGDIIVKRGGKYFAQFVKQKRVEIFTRLMRCYDGESEDVSFIRFMFALWHEADESKFDSHIEILPRDMERLAILKSVGYDISAIVSIRGFEFYEKLTAVIDDVDVRFSIFNDAKMYEDIHRSNVSDKSGRYTVIIKGRQILESKVNIAADIKYHIWNSINSGNRIIVVVQDEKEKEKVWNYLSEAGIPEGIQALGIEYRTEGVDEIFAYMSDARKRNITVIMDEGDVKIAGVNMVRYNPYIPDIITLAFCIAKKQGAFDVGKFANISLNDGIYEISTKIADMMREVAKRRVIEIAA